MPEKVNKPEADVIEESNERFKDARDNNNEWLQRTIDAYRFYTGLQQWDPQVLATLAREGRPALTINYIFPFVNLLWGFQSQNRDDIRLYPRHGGSGPVASLGTELIKHTLDTCEGHDEMSDAFGDGLIGGKGWLGVEMLFTNDVLNGDLIVEQKSPFNIIEDQNNRKYNVNRGRDIFEIYWWTKDQVELQWPGKAAELGQATESPDYEEDIFYEGLSHSSDDDYKEGTLAVRDSQRKTSYRIRERWYTQWESCVFVVHLPTLIVKRITPKHLKLIREKELMRGLESEFKIIERPAPVLYKTITVGDMVLEHIKDPFDGICLFPYFRFCPYWIDGYPLGVVDNIKDSQMELNKRRSQVLHHLNTTAHSGFKVGSAQDKIAVRELEQFGSKPGTIIDKSKFAGEVEEITPKPLDIGHFTMAEQSARDMQNITGINPSLLERSPEAKESGRAKLARQQIGLMPSQKIFDNFARTEIEIGTFLWEIIRTSEIYSEQEVESIVERSTLKEFMKVDQATGQQTIDLSPMRSWRFGKYGITVSRSQNVPTVRIANFEQMVEAAKAGLPIPPEMIIEASDWPNKKEITESLRQAQSQTALTRRAV